MTNKKTATAPKKTATAPKTARAKLGHNKPIASLAREFAASDATNTVKRSKIFAQLESAGATRDSLSAKGDDFKDFQRGVLAGWQGAVFANRFFKTSEGLVIMAGRNVTRFGDIEPVSKTRNEWNRDLSAKVGKLRAAYVEWLSNGVVPDAPAGADEVVDSRNGEKPAATTKRSTRSPGRRSGAKKAIRERIAHDAGAMAKA